MTPEELNKMHILNFLTPQIYSRNYLIEKEVCKQEREMNHFCNEFNSRCFVGEVFIINYENQSKYFTLKKPAFVKKTQTIVGTMLSLMAYVEEEKDCIILTKNMYLPR